MSYSWVIFQKTKVLNNYNSKILSLVENRELRLKLGHYPCP